MAVRAWRVLSIEPLRSSRRKVLPGEPDPFSAADGPDVFAGIPAALVSGRHLTWYGPSLTAAAEVPGRQLRRAVAGLARGRHDDALAAPRWTDLAGEPIAPGREVWHDGLAGEGLIRAATEPGLPARAAGIVAGQPEQWPPRWAVLPGLDEVMAVSGAGVG